MAPCFSTLIAEVSSSYPMTGESCYGFLVSYIIFIVKLLKSHEVMPREI